MNYNNKYKDRKPKETIKIIKNFFINQGFSLKEQKTYKTEIGTWWIGIDLYYKGYFIIHAAGKGMTEQFAKASGYAELYERFWTQSDELYATMAYQDIKKERYTKYGFYLAKDEKQISFESAINNSKRIKNKINLLNDNENSLKDIYTNIFNNKIIALPFKNLVNNDTIDIVPEILHSAVGTDGCAAGNTLEEALVQGISEIYEHMVWTQIYIENNKNIKLKEININTISISKQLKQKIIILQKKGYLFKIIDFSYTFDIPVVGILLLKKDTLNHFLILGAHPIFDIALERCFTEIYQGILTYDDFKNLMIPYKNCDDKLLLQYNHIGSISKRNCYNENLLYNTEIVDNYNQKCFIKFSNTKSNNEFLIYYIKLAEKKQYNFYYRNFSPLKNFFAVQIFIDNYENLFYINYEFLHANNQEKQEALLFLNKFLDSQKQYITNNNINNFINLFFEYKEKILLNKKFYHLVHDYLFYIPDCLSIYSKENTFLILFFIILNGINSTTILNNYLNDTTIHHYPLNKFSNLQLRTYLLQLSLLVQDKYSKQEIKNIFNLYHNIKYFKDLDKFNLFFEIFSTNFKNDIDYQNYIKKMANFF